MKTIGGKSGGTIAAAGFVVSAGIRLSRCFENCALVESPFRDLRSMMMLKESRSVAVEIDENENVDGQNG